MEMGEDCGGAVGGNGPGGDGSAAECTEPFDVMMCNKADTILVIMVTMLPKVHKQKYIFENTKDSVLARFHQEYLLFLLNTMSL